ncbi:2Fe-2S iron-sulfur cluster-binding protein [Nakamurella endophytica]|uniref:Phenylacetic acid degradation protein n=1 Tax=Nakamurella endophytica TaxID=1748367 RepID=A0A917SP94_9ACTN|nr:2Fe-2S iron-sulfur cluster-binding protein [Nakamurella endophytica]GGL89606.1 phenylacetic acid degradation protein [Nakamurella endophytica]
MRAPFHALTVAAVDRLTDDSAAVTLAVPAALADTFRHRAGQHLTVRIGDERRSYSLCSPAGAAPRIAVRTVDGGRVSGTLVHRLRPGDVLQVQPPTGTFTVDPAVGGRHVAIAAGSGITPVLSIAATVLAGSADARVTLLYGNRAAWSVMLADEVCDLKDRYPTRVQVVHVLSREPHEVPLFSGRLDAAKLRLLVPATVQPAEVDHWWLCGPYGLVADAQAVLGELGVAAERVHRELFFVEDQPPPVAQHPVTAPAGGSRATVVLDGRSSSLTVPAGTTILDAAQRVRPDLPFACRGGVCGTCRALLTGGQVHMRRNFALEPAETDRGYVLTCQSEPVSDQVTVDFDA